MLNLAKFCEAASDPAFTRSITQDIALAASASAPKPGM
jgi:hypothetical protein